jgi:hypothetical protein
MPGAVQALMASGQLKLRRMDGYQELSPSQERAA